MWWSHLLALLVTQYLVISIFHILPNKVLFIILLPEKFLPFDWLRAEVFKPKSPNNLTHELCKNGGRIARFWNQEIQELKENSENQNTEKSTSTSLNVWISWAENKNFKTNLLAYEAKQLNENKHMELDDWISKVVV